VARASRASFTAQDAPAAVAVWPRNERSSEPEPQQRHHLDPLKLRRHRGAGEDGLLPEPVSPSPRNERTFILEKREREREKGRFNYLN
jgi:hypothetical protein